MSRVLNFFDFIEGLRNSNQVLYKSKLYFEHSGIEKYFKACKANVQNRFMIF